MREELLCFEGDEEDIHLLGRERAERSHQHLEFRWEIILDNFGIGFLCFDFSLVFLNNLSFYPTVFHIDDAVGIGEMLGIMGDHDDGFSVDFVQFFQNVEHVLCGFAVEISDRFVGEDNVGVIDERSRDGDSLFLSSRELARKFVHLFRDAETTEELDAVFASGLDVLAAEGFGKADIFENIE